MHMYPTIQETGTVGKVQIGQKAAREVLQPQGHVPVSQQQQQVAQQQVVNQQLQQQNQQQQQVMQQMRQQMLEMQAEINEYRKPKPKMYSTGQVSILLSVESINQILEEFELSTQKHARLISARDWLLRLSDLNEWIPQQQGDQTQQIDEPGIDGQDGDAGYDSEDQSEARQYTEDELCDVSGSFTPPGVEPKGPEVSEADAYKGKIDSETSSELEKIEQRMTDLKQESPEKPDKTKHKSGIEKIKEFIMKKAPEDDQKPAPDYSNLPEGMG